MALSIPQDFPKPRLTKISPIGRLTKRVLIRDISPITQEPEVESFTVRRSSSSRSVSRKQQELMQPITPPTITPTITPPITNPFTPSSSSSTSFNFAKTKQLPLLKEKELLRKRLLRNKQLKVQQLIKRRPTKKGLRKFTFNKSKFGLVNRLKLTKK